MSSTTDLSQLFQWGSETDENNKLSVDNNICILCGSKLTKSNSSDESITLKNILAQIAFVDWFEFLNQNGCHFGFCENCQTKGKRLQEIADHLMKLREALIVWSNAIVVSMRKVLMTKMVEKIGDHPVLTDETHFRTWNSHRVERMLKKHLIGRESQELMQPKCQTGAGRLIDDRDKQVQINTDHQSQPTSPTNGKTVLTKQKDSNDLRSAEHFVDETNLNVKESSHEDIHEFIESASQFLCEVCGKSLHSKTALQKHLGMHRNGDHICHVCDRKFYSSFNLKNHLRLHTGERPFQCPHCPQNFVQKISMTHHVLKKHSSTHPFPCPHCSSGFNYKTALHHHLSTSHKSSYLELKPFICQVCHKNFKTPTELSSHAEVHDKHKCKLCNRQFKMMAHLKEHLLRHASIKPFKCSFCPSETQKSYLRRKALIDHIRAFHPDIGDPDAAAAKPENVNVIVEVSTTGSN